MSGGAVRGTQGERGKKHHQDGSCQPLEVDDGGGQEGLDLHVGEAAPNGTGKAMSGL